MIATIQYKSRKFQIDLSRPIDISIPITGNMDNVNAWYLGRPKIEPVVTDDWVGSVRQGASTNFNNIFFNPHAHGTHTECVGHITKEFNSVNKALKQFYFLAEVITVAPEKQGDDFVISKNNYGLHLGIRNARQSL